MKPIRVLDQNLNILAEIDDYLSLQFTLRWYQVGEFELQIDLKANDSDKLQKGNFILLGNDPKKTGIIRYREITLSTGMIIIKGQTLSGVLGQRIIIPPSGSVIDSITAVHETAMRSFVNNHVVSPTDANRKISLMTNGIDNALGTSKTWQARYTPLTDQLESIARDGNLGWGVEIDFTALKLVFQVYAGRDLTAGQSINPPVIFSPAFDSLNEQHYTDSDLNYRNFAYVGGAGEGTSRTVVNVGTDTDLNRLETFIDARDLSVSVDLTNRGNQKLAEMAVNRLLEAKISTTGPFQYGVDFELGDKVTIQNKDWNVTMDAVITEVKEIYEAQNGFSLEATFGNNAPTLISKLKHELGQMSAEIRR